MLLMWPTIPRDIQLKVVDRHYDILFGLVQNYLNIPFLIVINFIVCKNCVVKASSKYKRHVRNCIPFILNMGNHHKIQNNIIQGFK